MAAAPGDLILSVCSRLGPCCVSNLKSLALKYTSRWLRVIWGNGILGVVVGGWGSP